MELLGVVVVAILLLLALTWDARPEHGLASAPGHDIPHARNLQGQHTVMPAEPVPIRAPPRCSTYLMVRPAL